MNTMVFSVFLYDLHKCQETLLFSVLPVCQLLSLASEPFALHTNLCKGETLTNMSVGLLQDAHWPQKTHLKVPLVPAEKNVLYICKKIYIYCICTLIFFISLRHRKDNSEQTSFNLFFGQSPPCSESFIQCICISRCQTKNKRVIHTSRSFGHTYSFKGFFHL